MRYLLSQPTNLYYAWQVEVLLNNLLELNVDLSTVDLVCTGKSNDVWERLKRTYSANFYFYELNIPHVYPSIGRPNALKQHFAVYPELEKETFFYFDCDVLLLRDPKNWLLPLESGSICYMSDTRSYVGYSYLKSKEKQVTKNKESYDTDQILTELCEKVGIKLEILKNYDQNSGGAQAILKGVDSSFWADVERDCVTIYQFFHHSVPNSVNNRYFNNESEGFQSFCADMWALLWNLWKRNKRTVITKTLDFAWPGFGEDQMQFHNIFHNAGVCREDKHHERLFYKAAYIDRIPYGDDFSWVRPHTMSKFYVDNIEKTAKHTCLI